MISRSILQTLIYSDHFGFPLTIDEISLRLVGARSSRALLIRTLEQMLKKKVIAHTGNYYHLPGRKSLISRRLRRAKISQPLLTRARRLATQLSAVPGVLAVYLTGSLAMQNPRGDVDIDFMLITRPGRLWTTRFLLTLYTELFGLRRHPHSRNNQGKLCLNLYLTPDSYLLPIARRSLYTAYELIQAKPVYDPSQTQTDLLTTNSWIHTYLPNVTLGSDLKGSAQPRQNNQQGRSDPQGLLDFLEFLAYRLQLLYMRSKLTREYVTPNSAFFHPHNPGEKVLKKLRMSPFPKV
jgi:hypothetical protein